MLLVGPPASGKSTFAGALVEAGIVDPDGVLSTDAHRQALTGNAADTSADRRMWVRLRDELVKRMTAGATTVVDATNVYPRRRARHIRVAQEHHRPVIAVRFDVPLDELISRNAARGREVPIGALAGMAVEMERAVLDEALLSEGVDVVIGAETLKLRIFG